MTLMEVLNLMDHEVWVRVRVHDGRENNPEDDLVFWSADWIGGGLADPGMPTGLEDYLDWDADDLSVEVHPDDDRREPAPMIVVNAYTYAKPAPVEVLVLEKTSVRRDGFRDFWCRVFLDKECAKAALRDNYNSEIDASEEAPDYSKSFLLDDSASLVFPEGAEIRWEVHVKKTEDNDYR